MDVDYLAIGRNVAKYRKIEDKTQEQLAELSGLSLGMISTVETGKTKASIETLVNIANSLNITVDVLLYDNLNRKEHILTNRMINALDKCSQKELELLADSIEIQVSLIKKMNEK